METDGRYETLSKKEISQLEKEKRKLQKNLEGIRNMSRLPDALFVVDTRKEKIAVDEARKLKIPVIGVVDTNCDPDEVDYVIPGNDDALRSIRLFASRVADAVLSGRGIRESAQADDGTDVNGDDRTRRSARPASGASGASDHARLRVDDGRLSRARRPDPWPAVFLYGVGPRPGPKTDATAFDAAPAGRAGLETPTIQEKVQTWKSRQRW